MIERVLLVLLDGLERRALVATGGGELALAPGETVAHRPLLGSSRRHGPRRRRDLPARLAGRVPGLLHRQLGGLHLVGDSLILRADVVQELELVEQIGEARGLEHDRQS